MSFLKAGLIILTLMVGWLLLREGSAHIAPPAVIPAPAVFGP